MQKIINTTAYQNIPAYGGFGGNSTGPQLLSGIGTGQGSKSSLGNNTGQGMYNNKFGGSITIEGSNIEQIKKKKSSNRRNHMKRLAGTGS